MNRWLGLFGAAAAWYGAHELSTYFADYNCRHFWVAPTIHGFALVLSVSFGVLAFTHRQRDKFAGFIGVAAASLFSLVILWQGAATLIYNGCER